MTAFALQASFKFGENGQDMLNVQGDNEPEFTEHLNVATRLVTDLIGLGNDLRSAPVGTAQALGVLHQAGIQTRPVDVPPPMPPAPAAAPAASSGPCQICNKATNCKVCGGPTQLKVLKTWNAHDCFQQCNKGATWCKTPIPAAMANLAGNAPGLIYG